LDYYALPIVYTAWSIPSEMVADRVNKLRSDDYLGGNVTIPYKESIISLLDHKDEWGTKIGAINTIVKENNSLIGYNTDISGFLKSLKKTADFDPKGKSVLLLGAGGSARAVSFGLVGEGIESLIIANRTYDRAQSLVDELNHIFGDVSAVQISDDSLSDVVPKIDLIVNATSLGMRSADALGYSPIKGDWISSNSLVYDLVYTPSETKLMQDAKESGASIIGGLPMLIFQGAASFELWTGMEAPIDVMFQAAEKALRK
jgi:shikimate dehydrogenase